MADYPRDPIRARVVPLVMSTCRLCVPHPEFFDVETMNELNRLKRDYEKCVKFLCSKDHNAIELLNKIVNIECSLTEKYPSFAFVQLLSNNGQHDKGLEQLSSGLDVLCKYGLNLLTPVELRQPGWQKIIYGNQVFAKSVNHIQGAKALLRRLGYVFRDFFAEFDESAETESVVALVVDMIAVKHEIDAYLAKNHPHPDIIQQHLADNKRLTTSQGKTSQAEDSLIVCCICGGGATLNCSECDKVFCCGCSERQHMHPSRRAHQVSIIPASKNYNLAPGDMDGRQKVYASSESTSPSSVPSTGVLKSMFSYATSAYNYLIPKQTNLLPKPSLLEVPSELAKVTKKQKEEDEKEDDDDDFIDASSVAIGTESASTTPKAESSLYVINREEYRSHIVDTYDEIEQEKKDAKAKFEDLLSRSSPVKTAKHISKHSAHNRQMTQLTRKKGNIQETKLCRQMKEDGLAVVKALREAEKIGYLEEEFKCILLLNESSQPSDYMITEWADKIGLVHQLLTAEDLTCGHWMNSDRIRLALAECYGNVPEAVRVCANKWRQQIDDLWSLCYLDDPSTASEHIVKVLDDFSGDFEAAKNHLIKRLFTARIWCSVDEEKAEEEIYRRKVPCLDEELARTLQDASIDRERRIRMILVEADLPGWTRAERVLELLERSSELEGNICLQDIVEGTRTFGNIQECCDRYLQIECVMCFMKYPQQKIHTLGCCQCRICRECVTRYFEVVIREKYVRDMVCPKCQLPEIDKAGADLHFQFLSILLHPLLSADDFDLLQTKWRDWNLMQDPSFVWCAFDECKFGFLAEGNNSEVQCPSCKRSMCKDCKKQWEDQHLNVSCKAFNDWKIANDPEQQLIGLARHLEENGIECPQCKSRYSLAKGGCMHFTCGQCRHEFCSGCRQPFKRAGSCKQFQRCPTLGIHSHHPRDCLYYLKEYSTEKLQQLLRESNVVYDVDTDAVAHDGACSVMIQKVTETGAKDEACGNDTRPGYAGLCELHYKEYLVSLINRNGIDPISIMETDDLIHLLKRTDRLAPEQQGEEREDAHRKRIIELILAQIPLERQPLGNHLPVVIIHL